MHSILIGLGLEKLYGPGNHDRLDKIQVVLAHPEATTALLSGRSEITAHMSTIPFQNQQLEDPRVHTVMNSYDVTDGPSTVTQATIRSDNVVYARLTLDVTRNNPGQVLPRSAAPQRPANF